MQTTEPKFDVEVSLVGEDGNAMAIMARVGKVLRHVGATKEQIDQYYKESMSGDYDNLLRVAMKWVRVR